MSRTCASTSSPRVRSGSGRCTSASPRANRNRARPKSSPVCSTIRSGLIDVAHGGVVGEQHAGGDGGHVRVADDDGVRHGSVLAGYRRRRSLKSLRHPGCPSPHLAKPRAAYAAASGDPMIRFPLVGSPSASSITFVRPADHVGYFIGLALGLDRCIGQADGEGGIADRIDERHVLRRPAAMPREGGRSWCIPSPAPPCRWRATLYPRRSSHSRRSSSNRGRTMLAWTRQALPHSRVRGAMRIAVRLGHRTATHQRPGWRAPSSAVPRRCRGWSTTRRLACASGTRQAGRRLPRDARR